MRQDLAALDARMTAVLAAHAHINGSSHGGAAESEVHELSRVVGELSSRLEASHQAREELAAELVSLREELQCARIEEAATKDALAQVKVEMSALQSTLVSSVESLPPSRHPRNPRQLGSSTPTCLTPTAPHTLRPWCSRRTPPNLCPTRP